MTFDPAKIGCNSKPHFLSFSRILQESIDLSLETEWSDLTEMPNQTAFSVDTVGVVSVNDLGMSAESAVAHCISDIICRCYQPTHIGISLAVNSQILDDQKLKEFLKQIKQACANNGSILGKSHTILGSENFLTVLTIGRVANNQASLESGKLYDLVLTKRLGALRTFFLNDINKQDIELEKSSKSSLIQSHVAALPALALACNASTDVSGNGLVGTLFLLSKKNNLLINVDPDSILYMGQEFGDVPLSCGSRNNRESFRGNVEIQKSINASLEETLFSPEYSGPILALVETEKTDSVLNNLKAESYNFAHKIGTAQISDRPHVQIGTKNEI